MLTRSSQSAVTFLEVDRDQTKVAYLGCPIIVDQNICLSKRNLTNTDESVALDSLA
jgi:hypothetical protein